MNRRRQAPKAMPRLQKDVDAVWGALPPAKVDVFDSLQVKNLLDDNARIYALNCCIKEDNFSMDLKLMLTTLAVVLSLTGVAYSYFIPYPRCRTVLLTSVIGYFCVSALLTLLSFYKSADIIMEAKQSADRNLTLMTSMSRFSSTYSISITLKSDSGLNGTAKTESSITSFFDEEGHFAAGKFKDTIVTLFKQADEDFKLKKL